MSFDYKRLAQITTIPSSAGAIYTNPTGKKSYIRLIQLHNTNTTDELVKLYNVPNSTGSVGTAVATNKFYEYIMTPNETIQIEYAPPGLILEDVNDTIQAVTTTASKVTIEITGGQE